MKRMWINQPSKQQTAHVWHGINVLAVDDGDDHKRVYFLYGTTESARLPTPCLSEGWTGDVGSEYAKAVIARGPLATAQELDRLQAKIVDIQRIIDPNSKVAAIAFR